MKYTFSAPRPEIHANILLYADSVVTGKNAMHIRDIFSPGCLFCRDQGITG